MVLGYLSHTIISYSFCIITLLTVAVSEPYSDHAILPTTNNDPFSSTQCPLITNSGLCWPEETCNASPLPSFAPVTSVDTAITTAMGTNFAFVTSSSSTSDGIIQKQEILDVASLDVDENSFPSFEEWRKQNLEKQPPEEIDCESSVNNCNNNELDDKECGHISNSNSKSDISPTSINNMEQRQSSEEEVNAVEKQTGNTGFARELETQEEDVDDGEWIMDNEGNTNKKYKSTDGKLYKDRFNYASYDCAATIMKTNTDTKGAPNILSENKDTYLLNKCSSQNKFVIVELCQDILVDTVAIANFEFFSSMFRHIRVSVSDRFPVGSDGWHELGEYEAASVRKLQYFYIKNPFIWARYVRVDFLSHWGNEFYCPISLIRVHGTTMMDEYKNQEEKERKQNIKQSEISSPPSVSSELHKNRSASDDSIRGTSSSSLASEENKDYSTGLFETMSVAKHLPEHNHDKTTNSNFSILKSNVSMSSNISPLVLNESCSWDDYVKDHDIFLNQIIPDNQTTNNDTDDTNTMASFSQPQSISPFIPQQTQFQEPKTQESIYQTIMKRLSLLESNATLSLKYIEEQSQNLRDLLLKIEKKQNMRIELFFNEFNKSVVDQLEMFQTQYSNLLMETVYDLENQRRRSDRDVSALSSRLSLMADELVYQKKIGLAQALVLLVILVFVIITRGTQVDSYSFASIHNGNHGFIQSWGPSFSSWPASPLSTPRSPPTGNVSPENYQSEDEEITSEHRRSYLKRVEKDGSSNIEPPNPAPFSCNSGHHTSLSTNDLSIYEEKYFGSEKENGTHDYIRYEGDGDESDEFYDSDYVVHIYDKNTAADVNINEAKF